MAITTLSPCAPDTQSTNYMITGLTRDHVFSQMEQVRQNALPVKVVFKGPFMINGLFVTEGCARGYVEG